MRKNLLALSIATMIGGLGFAGAANAGVSLAGTGVVGATGTATLTVTDATALAVTPNGIGHIAVVPYFTTQSGNATLLNLVNTDTINGKAVKIRFRGAANSDDIFDFQLYMSPGDVWTANISAGADGISTLTTADKTCTYPSVVGTAPQGNKFVTDRLPATFTADQKANWTREGYVEIFNMADIPPSLANTTPVTVNPLFTAIKHVAGVAPCTPATLSARLLTDPAGETVAAARGFDTPTGTLTVNATITNIAGASVAWSGEATSIIAVVAAAPTVPVRGRMVFSPQTSDVAPTPDLFTNDPLFRTDNAFASPATNPIIPAANFDLPDLSTPYTGNVNPTITSSPLAQATALSGSLAVRGIVNEYLTNPSISAATDWVFSAPTRRYAVAMDYIFLTAGNFNVRFNTNAPTNAPSLYYTAANSTRSGALICVAPGGVGGLTTFDQEETTSTSGAVISPGSLASLSFCGEVSVLGFNTGKTGALGDATNVLGAAVAPKFIEAGYANGWISIATPGLANAGLPVIGASYAKATGPLVASKSTTFGLSYAHKNIR